jgi:hypothetical protein
LITILTFDPSTFQQQRSDPQAIENFRTAGFDLDNLGMMQRFHNGIAALYPAKSFAELPARGRSALSMGRGP